MSKRYKKNGGRVPHPAPTPVKGALRADQSAALEMIARFEELEKQQRLLLEANQAMSAQVEQLKIDRDKALESMAAAKEQLVKVMEQKPLDPAMLKEMAVAAQADARRQFTEGQTRFKESLESMPRGQIDARSLVHPYPLGINACYFLVKPGIINTDVPQAFVDEWENRQIAIAAATEFQRKLSLGGDMNKMLEASQFQAILDTQKGRPDLRLQ